MMKKMLFSFVSVFALTCVIGCGGGDAPEVSADQSEVEKWVAENPAPEEVPLDEE